MLFIIIIFNLSETMNRNFNKKKNASKKGVSFLRVLDWIVKIKFIFIYLLLLLLGLN
jgi:hypothetical protein